MLNSIFSKIGAFWRKLGLATQTLAVVEPLCYGISVLLFATNAGWLYFIGTGSVALLGFIVAHKAGGDTGRTVAQLYAIDVLLHIAGVAYYLFVQDDTWFYRCEFFYKSLIIGLSLAKVLAISATIGVPGQAGWPRLIPFIKHRRDVQGTLKTDLIIYSAIAASFGFGFWIQSDEVPINPLTWFVPSLLIIIVDAIKIRGAKSIEALSPRAKDFAVKFDGFATDEKDVAERMIVNVLDAKRKVPLRKPEQD